MEKKIKIKKNQDWGDSYDGQVEKYKNVDSWLSNNKEIGEFILGKGIGSVGQSYFQGKGKNNVIDWLIKNKVLISSIINASDDIENRIKSYTDFQDGVIKVGGRNCWMAVHAMVAALQPEFLCNILSEDKLDRLYELLTEVASDVSAEEGQGGKDPENGNQQGDNDQNGHGSNSEDIITLIFSNNSLDKSGDKSTDVDPWELLKKGWADANKHKNKNTSWYYKSAAVYKYFQECCKNNWRCDVPWQVLMALTGDERIENLAKRLEYQKNIILTGAPGTGKTYMAKQIAAKMIGIKTNALQNSGQYEFVQFHPSYDYTDFVEGLRPNNTGASFTRMDGTFKAFCAKAAIAEKGDETEKKKKFVFVIDEINRGEISKIFGELFFSIDPGYRGEKDDKGNDNRVRTQYQNLILKNEKMKNADGKYTNYPFIKGFYVPRNVYIIGTMNDIDRSVESMDFAFRRRFAFVEITAADSEHMLNELRDSQTLINKMDSLNDAIIDPAKGGLSPQYQIGAAYFHKMKDFRSNSYNRLWDEYLKGVLYEYFRGMPDAEKKLSLLKKAYDGKTDNED